MHLGINFGVRVASSESNKKSITLLTIKFPLTIKDMHALGLIWGQNILLHSLLILVDHRILIVPYELSYLITQFYSRLSAIANLLHMLAYLFF